MHNIDLNQPPDVNPTEGIRFPRPKSSVQGSYQVNDNEIGIKCICEALNCYSEAKTTVDVSAGKYGILHINVCENCVRIFRNLGGAINNTS